MNNSINYPNQQLPQYSGITINITNPNLTAPMSGNSYYVPQQYPCNTNCENFYPANNNLTNNRMDTMNSNGVTTPDFSNRNNTTLNQAEQLPQGYPSGYYINNYNMQNPQAMPHQNHPQIKPEDNQEKVNITTSNNFSEQGKTGQDNNIIPAINPTPANATNQALNDEKITEDSEEQNMDSSTEIINKLNNKVAEEKELEKNGKKTRVVALTNEYIMSLENYLNNPNREIRLMAGKEILTRLDEDKTRYDDKALNALLNKMLQDPDKLVRIAALSAFSSQLASGNDFTIQLLNEIQNNPNAEKDDVLEAANILLKMSSSTEIRYTPVKNNTNTAQNTNQEKNEKEIAQLKEQLNKYKEKEITELLKKEGLS